MGKTDDMQLTKNKFVVPRRNRQYQKREKKLKSEEKCLDHAMSSNLFFSFPWFLNDSYIERLAIKMIRLVISLLK